MLSTIAVRWTSLGEGPTSRPPLLIIHTRKLEMPVLIVRSRSSEEDVIPLRARARLVSEEYTSFSRPCTADAKKIARPLFAHLINCPSSSERYKYFQEAIKQVFGIAGSAEGGDIELYYAIHVYVPVEAEAIEASPSGQLAYAEKGVRKMTHREIDEESSSSTRCCAICLEEFEEGEAAVRLTCSHVLHGMCLDSWFRQKHHCPLCRREIMWHFARESGI